MSLTLPKVLPRKERSKSDRGGCNRSLKFLLKLLFGPLIFILTIIVLIKGFSAVKSFVADGNFNNTLNEVSSMLENDSGLQMSSNTASKAVELNKKLSDLAKLKTEMDGANWLEKIFLRVKYNKCLASVSKTKQQYNNAKSRDPVYKESLAQREGNSPKIPVWLFIVIGIPLLVFLLWRFIKKKLHKEEPTELPVQQPKEQNSSEERTLPPVRDVQTTEELKVNYDRLLQKNCKKLNLDYDSVLKEHGGNAREAVEATEMLFV